MKLVLKLGGSLTPHIPELVRTFQRSGQDILIVPGGGAMADAVRALSPPGEAAHWMAVLAMEQTGWYIASQGAVPFEELRCPDGVSVLLPYRVMREHDPLPHSWDVTSDTISAWVAFELGLDLLLLKSVEGIISGSRCLSEVREPVDTDTVDPCFLPFVLSRGLHARVIDGREPDRVLRALTGRPVPGTRINTII